MPSRDATQCDRNSYKREPGRRNRLKKPNLKNKFLSRRRETRLQLCPHHLRLLFSQKVFQTRQVLTACFPFFPVYFLLVFFFVIFKFPANNNEEKSRLSDTPDDIRSITGGLVNQPSREPPTTSESSQENI
jgi:hypothetical protein